MPAGTFVQSTPGKAVFSPCVSWRSLHQGIRLREASSSPGAYTRGLLRKSRTLPKPQSLSSKCCLQKTPVTLSTSCSLVCGPEVVLLCKLDATLSQPISLSLPFVPPWKGSPPLHSTVVFLSPNSFPCNSHLPHHLPPIVETFLTLCRSISWVFQVI